ncbi:hypothetical protein ACHWQZ_G015595 [Mnemiopsis leidyi]
MCGTGDCILSSLKCDGENDCHDGTDEDNCPTTTGHHSNCMAREFQCLSGRCISERMRCDGTRDCDDGSDEDPRTCLENNQCNREDFLCDGSKCLSREKRCDGHGDCLDGTDELNCDGPECADTQFTCTASRECIDETKRCDRNNDCPDGSDEFNCPAVCYATEFKCDNDEICVSLTSRCDGANDCRDGSDERGCGEETPLCPEGERKCSPTHGENDVCIPESDFCNNINDCPDGSDEIGCDCQEQPDMIPCPGSRHCIHKDQWCDKVPHCDNRADERADCCKIGYYRPNRNPLEECVDENECDRQDGVCSQHCLNTEGGFECSCDPGYDLVDTTKQNGVFSSMSYCRAQGDMNILITVRSELYRLNVPEGSGESLDSGGARSTGNFKSISMSEDYDSQLLMADFDFDIRNKKLFWCSTPHYALAMYARAIWVADLGDNLESLRNSKIIVNNINCDSMAVDWINKLVYFTSETNSIEVVDYEGNNRRALIWTGLGAPRAIELDPDYGLLFYTDWGLNTAHLGRANMDGSDRRSLINNTSSVQIEWPNALTIDHPNKNLYWMDARMRSIECMRYDGSARYTISNKDSALVFPFRMRVFQDRVYWREKDGAVKFANKFTGNQFMTVPVVSEGGEKLAEGTGLRIYHPVIQPESTPRCRPGLCSKSALCLPVPDGYQCACATGYSLLPDNFNCAYTMDTFAIVAMKEMITKTALEPLEPVLQPITFKHDKYLEGTFWSVDFHENWVYYNTLSNNISQISIRKMLFDGRDSKVVVNEKSYGGLSIDWLNEKIYWSSAETVSVGELDGSVHTTLLQKEGFNFRDILVDPCNGYIYLAALGRGIYRCSMDGDISSFTEIVSLGPESMPSGLTLDRDIGALFYANKNSIYKLTLYHTEPTPEPIVHRPQGVNIKSLDVWGRDKIIWTESYLVHHLDNSKSLDRIAAMPKLGSTGSQVQVIREDIKKTTFGIKVSPKRDSVCQGLLGANPCSDNQCSHMCLQSQVSGSKDHPKKGYRCVCPTGYALRENSTTQCADEIAQYLVYNPQSGIQTVSLDTNFLTPIKGPPNMSFKVTSFDIDAKNNLVYYCYGNPNKFEVRGLFDESGDVTALPIYTTQCSGMAVEWITNKLYVVDRAQGLILVVNLDKPYLTKSIVHKLNNPLDVVVHPRKGKIYWILESHSIMSTNMDGTDVIETIVSVAKGPGDRTLTFDDSTTQMFIDFTTDHLYWTENVHQSGVGFLGLIKRVDLTNKDAETILEMRQTPLAGATMINNNIYFTDLQDGRLYRKEGATNGTFLLTTSSGSFLLSSQSQPQLLEDPCAVDNGGCSDFCLLDSLTRYRCSCPTGIQLQDTMNCDTPHNKSLVVANDTRISMISLSSPEPVIDRVLTSVPKNLKSIDVDIRENKIYWSEINLEGGAIWVLDMKTGETEKIVWEDMLRPNSIAVDWNAQNIYWVDSSPEGKGTLEVMSLRSRKRSVLKKYDEVSKRPHKIVLDPNEKLLFVSYPVPVKEVITRMWMDGSNPFDIMTMDIRGPTQRGAQVVSSLAIDLIDKKLYWSSNDAINHISSCDYAGGHKDINNDHHDRHVETLSILNRNMFVQKLEYSADTEVQEYQEYENGETQHSKTYTFHHLKGNIVSMRVSSVAVLEDADLPCRANMCAERICIPNDIEAFCRCGDDDKSCQEENEQKVEVIMNHLPDTPNLCANSPCDKDHGTCIQFKHPTNGSYISRCECEEGWSGKRCGKESSGSNVIVIVIVTAFFAIVVVLMLVYAWWRRAHDKTYQSDRLRDHSSEGDDTETFQQDQQAKKLAQLATTGIGRSYLQTKKDNNCVEQFV